MVELNNEIRNGIDELDCDKNMKWFLKELLEYELKLEDSYESTRDKKQKYIKLIENYSKED